MDGAYRDPVEPLGIGFGIRRRLLGGLVGGALGALGARHIDGGSTRAALWPVPPRPVPPPPPATGAVLDEETLQRLTIVAIPPGPVPADFPVGSLAGTIQLLPGGSARLILGVYDCCYFFHPVPAHAVWSVTPREGADIDPTTGLLTVDATTPSGSVYLVRADVEHGRRIVEADVRVFTPEANPLIGFWRELAYLDCATGSEMTPSNPIQELIFNADGTFTVTWHPFEVYHDYWGSYAFDLVSGALTLTIENGNYIPPDVDGDGRFAVDAAGRLVLTGFWLGTPPGEDAPAGCGHVFTS